MRSIKNLFLMILISFLGLMLLLSDNMNAMAATVVPSLESMTSGSAAPPNTSIPSLPSSMMGQTAEHAAIRVTFMTASATTASLIFPSGPYITEPKFVATDSGGNIYITLVTDNMVKLSTSGTQLLKFGSYGTANGQFNNTGGIALDLSGNIYVVDENNNRVEKFNSAGTFQGWIGNCSSGTNCDTTNHVTTEFCNDCVMFSFSGTTNGQFNGPYAIALDSTGNIYVTDYYNNRVEKFNSAGVYQFQFGSTGTTNGQFNGPVGIALDSTGNIYVVDRGNNRVEKFNSAGVYQFQFGSTGTTNGQFNGPYAIALDSTGNIYVTDYGNNRVEKFNSAGVYQFQLGCTSGACSTDSGNGQFNGPAGIALDSTDNIYVTDYGNNRVEKFNSAGVYQFQFGSTGTTNGQFNGPAGIALDSTDNIYVTDYGNNRVEKFNSAGVYQFQFGSTGTANGQFNGPAGIALDSTDNIYVVDENNNRVEKFNSAGTFQGWIGNCSSGTNCDTTNHVTTEFCNDCVMFSFSGTTNGQFNGPSGIALDSTGNIYVTDYYNNRVEKFNSAGVYQFQFGSTGTTNGQFNGPVGIALDSTGNIYVVDRGNNRVEKFNSAGVYQFQFGSTGTANGQFDGPNRIALDSTGNIYVTETGNNRVQTFNSAGVYQSKFGSFGTDNNQFDFPVGIALDQSYNIYVADNSNNRVEKFPPSITTCSPASGDWTITSSCTLISSVTVSANVVINSGVLLIIPNGVTLTIHFTTNHLLVNSGGGVLINAGGAID